MSSQEASGGKGVAIRTLVHCPSCETRKPMVIKQLVFRLGGDKIIYRCVECDAEVALPAK